MKTIQLDNPCTILIVEKYLLTDERMMVVSDHGLTAFAIAMFENQKKYSFDNADHEGRCL